MIMEWEQTHEEERRLNWCSDLPCIWDCKRCLALTLSQDWEDE